MPWATMKMVAAPMEIMLNNNRGDIRIDVNNMIRYSAKKLLTLIKKEAQMVMRRCHVIELAKKAQRAENKKRVENGCTLENSKKPIHSVRKIIFNVLNRYRNSR